MCGGDEPWNGEDGRETKTYSTQVPRDVAMERPHPRIIRVVLQHHVPVRSQIVRVPPQRVQRVDDGVAVPLAVAFVQDPVFVAVEVHRLCGV